MRIAVLLGGALAERDVSIALGREIGACACAGIRSRRSIPPSARSPKPASRRCATRRSRLRRPRSRRLHESAVPGAVDERNSLELITFPAIREADVVCIALHGGQGEDGTLQAILDTAAVPYTGSGHLASALAMDKDLSKVLFRAAGVGTADWAMAPIEETVAIERLKLPLVVKPSKQGSTVGLTVVSDRAQLSPAIRTASQYDDEVMLEQFIPGRDATVGVLGDSALPVGEIFPKHPIYDYECKYTAGMAREDFPASLTPAETAEVQRQAVAAFRALKLRGYARIDFRMDPSGALRASKRTRRPEYWYESHSTGRRRRGDFLPGAV